VASEPIQAKLQHDFARTRWPGTFTLNYFQPFEKAANVDQQACEFRTNGVECVMYALPCGNHRFRERVGPFATAATATGR
jgi:hypothetical protein